MNETTTSIDSKPTIEETADSPDLESPSKTNETDTSPTSDTQQEARSASNQTTSSNSTGQDEADGGAFQEVVGILERRCDPTINSKCNYITQSIINRAFPETDCYACLNNFGNEKSHFCSSVDSFKEFKMKK